MLGLAALAILLLLTFFCLASPALAGTVTNERPLLDAFDGSDTAAGAFAKPQAIAIDNSTGNVYVLTSAGSPAHGVVDKFNAGGEATNFAATGESSLDGTPGGPFKALWYDSDIAVDNSAVNPGRLYVADRLGGGIHAFDPEGNHLWTLPETTVDPCGIAVDGEGHLWVVDEDKKEAIEFAASGSPPAPINSVPLTSGQGPCHPGIDQSGNDLYVGDQVNRGLFGSEFNGVRKYVGGAFDSILSDESSQDVAVDQKNPKGHIFALHGVINPTPEDGFDEFEPCAEPKCPVKGSPFGGDLLGNGLGEPDVFGIAHNSTLDWVYVSDAASNTVKVFGPITSGTIPDVSTTATDGLTRSEAIAHGTINPQSLPHTYHFEWKAGTASSWGAAQSSPLQSIEPTDSSLHLVSLPLTELNQNTTYQVRLVGTNSGSHLSEYSSPDTFKTLPPPPPTVSIDSISAITTSSAHIVATINPQQDITKWLVLKKEGSGAAESECEAFEDAEFSIVKEGTIPNKTPGSVQVEADLEGLEPAQTNCVRVVATNSGGAGSASDSFKTPTIPPSEASTAFAAPRLDTSARLNARVNPEGEAILSYRFEWSEDGVNWTALPLRESTVNARRQIVIADELLGLEPDTTYHYRLALVENEAGPAPIPPEAKTFTTRTSAEVNPPSPCPNEALRVAQGTDSYLGACRTIELVNSPDKGNQNVRTEITQGASPLSADGERAVWNVLSGAPGGNVGVGSTFLAQRTPQGWQSRAVLAPAPQGAGGSEEGGYSLATTTPDLSAFVFNAGIGALSPEGASERLVWVDASQGQRLLAEYPEPVNGGRADMTDDGAHVFFVDAGGLHQLEDLGPAPPETVSLLPDGVPSECGLDITDSNRSFVGGGANPEAAALLWRPGYHMVATTDASRVFFQAKPNGKPCGSAFYGIYVRDREGKETTLIDPGTGISPNFIRATPDGRQAYFLTSSSCRKFTYPQLTCQIPEPADANSHADVYRWDEGAGEGGESECLTCVVAEAEVARTIGGVMVSDDFSHVYFQSSKQLVPGQGKAGELNIYSLSGGAIDFVANPNDGASLSEGNALLSANGEVLVFMTSNSTSAHQELTADRLAAKCAQLKNTTPQPCEELIRYDDRDGSLECLSCHHGAITENSVGVAVAPAGHEFKMSADGSTVAFTTAEALLPDDVNRSTDVYEWRNGVRSLLSDGVTTYPQSFTASPQLHAVGGDGADILFSLVDPTLTGFEQDGFANLYDARIGGGFAVPNPPAHCSEESCQGPLQAAPRVDRPNSSSFFGQGNMRPRPRPRPCARKRGKAKRRCIAKHKRRSQRASARARAGRTR